MLRWNISKWHPITKRTKERQRRTRKWIEWIITRYKVGGSRSQLGTQWVVGGTVGLGGEAIVGRLGVAIIYIVGLAIIYVVGLAIILVVGVAIILVVIIIIIGWILYSITINSIINELVGE